MIILRIIWLIALLCVLGISRSFIFPGDTPTTWPQEFGLYFYSMAMTFFVAAIPGIWSRL